MITRRRLPWLLLAASLVACLPEAPVAPVATRSPRVAPGVAPIGTATPAPATAQPAALIPVAASAAAGATPTPPDLIADDDVADTDRQELLSLFNGSDSLIYLPSDMISDGSGAYLSITALGDRRPDVRFRRAQPQTVSRQLRLAYASGSRDRAVARMTVRQTVAWEVITPEGTRTVTGQLRQIRELQALRNARRWRLDKVGTVRVQPDTDTPPITIQALTLLADDLPLVRVSQDSPAADVSAIPTVKGGQRLTVSATLAPTTADPAPVLLGTLRAQGLGFAGRLNPDAAGTTLSRTVEVPNRPGTYHVGAEVVNLSALVPPTSQAVFTSWAVTVKVQ
jgi:hypothetical protein